MRCGIAKKLIWREADSTLGTAQSQALADHLSGCANCRAEQANIAKTLALLDGWHAPQPVRDYNYFLMNHATAHKPVQTLRRWAVGALAVMSIACGVALGIVTSEPAARAIPTEQEVVNAMRLHTFEDVIELAISHTPDGRGEEVDL